MNLNELSPSQGSCRKRNRVGRGNGSGHGTTSCRGSKGHNARSGGGVRPGFEGGQMPIHRRLPKRGITNIFKKEYAVLNLKDLDRFESGAVVDEAALVRAGLVKGRRDGVKLLGNGELKSSLTIRINKISQSAREKVEQAGGSVEVI